MRSFFVVTALATQVTGCYLTRQGYRQFELLSNRIAISQVLKDERLPVKDREKLTLTNHALEFAQKAGLNVGNSYRHYVQLDGNAVSYIVQAAKPTELELKKWWFPIVGSVPYLGFFDRDERDREATALERDGYEVHRGSVAAYSSLGWFADPVFSSMLRRSDGELVHLYFHELTHRTIWLKDGVEFNENLAEFVADILTAAFFKAKNRLQEIEELKLSQQDYQLFKVWLKRLRSDLEESLRASIGRPDADRIVAKNQIISLAISQKPRFKQDDFVGSGRWNNARILAASLYTPDITAFERAASCFTDKSSPSWVGNFLKALKKKAETTANGFLALQALCQSN